MTDAARLRGTRGLFLLSHHPWALVVVLVVVVLVVYYQNQRRR